MIDVDNNVAIAREELGDEAVIKARESQARPKDDEWEVTRPIVCLVGLFLPVGNVRTASLEEEAGKVNIPIRMGRCHNCGHVGGHIW